MPLNRPLAHARLATTSPGIRDDLPGCTTPDEYDEQRYKVYSEHALVDAGRDHA
ncbi:hypothetical protein [Streptomyces sp. NRRL WC-3742]|uniref:hypothetical protein n=1 Tax=Streptomyces sp. NRRL WC-3742 TaxID=1463934 RepID=UPI00131C9E2A|nr:hypothetical protein [Streptomyces sp. NRRL WC-3742]